MPIVWAGVGLASLFGVYNASDKLATALKWGTAAGVVYLISKRVK